MLLQQYMRDHICFGSQNIKLCVPPFIHETQESKFTFEFSTGAAVFVRRILPTLSHRCDLRRSLFRRRSVLVKVSALNRILLRTLNLVQR